jgi:enterochelin esterase-like enzyme
MFTVEMIKTPHQITSAFLKRQVMLEIYAPAHTAAQTPLHLLLFNDGQEAEALELASTAASLLSAGKMEPLLIVAIKAGEDRLQEYGVAGVLDFMGRGAKAGAYTQFIVAELLPYLSATFKTLGRGKCGFAGCSLGGLSAFDIAWHHPDLFHVAGVFSGAFWWRKKAFEEGYSDQDRILHEQIRQTPTKPGVKFWLMTGTEDETADRNHNYIIDSIDDTIDVIKELMLKGYTRPEEVFYYEMVGGKHHPSSWAKALPGFLTWAFPTPFFHI